MPQIAAGIFANTNTLGTPKKGGGDASTGATVTAYSALNDIYKREAKKILMEVGEIILTKAKMNIGWAGGSLEASGRVVIEETGKGPRVAIKFGGDDNPVAPSINTRGGLKGDGVVDYAFFVHEDIHPQGSGLQPGKKFLERALIETQSQVVSLITKRLKSATRLKQPRSL